MNPVQSRQPGIVEDLTKLLSVMKGAKGRSDALMRVWDHDVTAVERAISHIEEQSVNERAYEAALGERTYNEVAAHIRELEDAPPPGTPQVMEALEDLQEWCMIEREKLGAVDGHDYRSGEEYGLRRAEIEIGRRFASLAKPGDS